jgi:hypothetical protein
MIISVLIVACGMGVLSAVIFTLPPLVVTAKEVPDSAKRVELQNSDQLDDLVDCQDEAEPAIIGARLLTSAAELTLLERRGRIGPRQMATGTAPGRQSRPRSRTRRHIPLSCRSK